MAPRPMAALAAGLLLAMAQECAGFSGGAMAPLGCSAGVRREAKRMPPWLMASQVCDQQGWRWERRTQGRDANGGNFCRRPW